LPPRVVTPDHPLLELIGSSDDDTDTADGEIQSEDRARYSSFEKTVLSMFRKLTIDFRIPDITLTIGEIFSMCIGARYLSVNGSVKTIGATAFAFQRVGAVVERGCIPSRRKGHFVLPPFVNDRDELA
jgi:hypothetical protein